MGLPREYVMIRSGENLCCSMHINSQLEVVYVKKGPFAIKYEDKELVLNDNEATVILPYRIHGFDHGAGIDVKIIMFSYSIAEEFYNNNRVLEMKKDIFSLPQHLQQFVERELSYTLESGSVFAIKSIFFPLISEYLKDNEGIECSKAGANEVRRIIDYISDKVTEGITADDVALSVGISKAKIRQIFKSYLGVSFNEFISTVRVEKASNLLLGTDMSVTEIAFCCGFGSLRNFNRVFVKKLNCTPGELRKTGGNRMKVYK